MAWSPDSCSRQHFSFPLHCPPALPLFLCCFVFCWAPFVFLRLPFPWNSSACSRLTHPHLFPSVTAFQKSGFYVCKYSSSPPTWLLPLCCLHGARPSALTASAASPSAASGPRRSSLPFPRAIVLPSHTASFRIPPFPSAGVPSTGPPLHSSGPSSTPPSVSPVIRSLRLLPLRRAPCVHTLLSSPLVACAASQWRIFPACSLVLLFVSVALCYLFFKRRSAASVTPLRPQEQQQIRKHAAASWMPLPVSLRPLLHGVRFSFSAAGAPDPASTPSAAGGAAARTVHTLRPTSARAEAVHDGTAAVRVATGCFALLASPAPTVSCDKASRTQLDSAIIDPPSPRCATASGSPAVEIHSATTALLSAAPVLHYAAAVEARSTAAAVAVHSAVTAVQAQASSGSATRADRAGRGAGGFLDRAATGAELHDRSPPALAVAFRESVLLKRLSLLFILRATADLLAAAPSTLYVCLVLCTSLLVAAICRAESHSQREGTRVTCLSLRLWPLLLTTAAVCEDAGKRQKRKRHSRGFSALRGLCGVTYLAAFFLILPAASCGCEANCHSEAFSSYHESPLSPSAQHLHVPFPPRHAAPPAFSSSYCRSGCSPRTLRCSLCAFEVPRPFSSFGFSFAAGARPCFRSSSLPLLPRGRQLPSSAVPQHRESNREKPSASLTSRVSGPLDCSSIHPPISFPLLATSHACIPGFLSFPSDVPSIFCLPLRSLPCGVFLPIRTGVACSTFGRTPSSSLLVVSASPPSGALSSGAAAPPPSLSKSSLLASCSLWQPPAPLSPSRSLHRRLSSCDFCYLVRHVCLRRKGRVELSLAAVRRHGRPGTGTQTTRDLQQDSEEEKEEKEVLSRLPYVSGEDTEATKRPPARGAPAAPHYDFFTGSSTLPPEESEEEEKERGERAQHLKTVLRKTSRFGSLTDPGEPPTPPPPSPFWPSYPPKKVSALPGGVLPRWHPRSPFPPLQPRGPFYPKQKRPQQESQRAPGAPQEKNKTEEGDQKESGTEPDAGAGLPDKPPDLPKNYRNWVRDSRYEYPQFTTLTASLRYRRHLKRSSRKLDWRLKNVQFRRMYFAWRRNMRDQEMHRWMREKMRWSKLAAEYWRREYSRQEEEWARKTRLQPRVKKEGVPAQEMGEVAAATQERRPQEDSKLQPRPGERVESSADEGLSVGRRGSNASGELYDHKKEETAPTDARGGRRMRKSGAAQETPKKSGIGSAEKLAPASLSALDVGGFSEQRLGRRTKDSVFHRRKEGKAAAEGQGTEVDTSVEEEGLESRDTGGSGENSELSTGGNLTPRDLASRVMSLLSPQEIKEIITNGYRLPPFTAAVAASPVPWWASCKGEHKWRGRKTATNVQSRWVNWANPHRLVEAAVGRCWLPREGGVLKVLREKGEELAETLERVQRGEEIAGFYRHPEAGERGESTGGQQNTLDRWSNEALSMDEVLRKMWKRKKMQKGQEGREREEAIKEAEDENRSCEPVSLPEADTSTACRTEQAENDGEAGGRVPQRDNQERIAEKKAREAVAAGDVEEKERGRPGFECIDEGRARQRAQLSCDTAVESLADASGASAMQHTPDTCAAPSKRNVDLPVSGYGVKSFLDDPEKHRKAIEAAIDVSLMLGHSTIVKTHGASVPYDVHSPFMRSHTSSRRRRMRLRGREKNSEKRNMTRQERRLANRDARLEQEKKRKEAAKAARRRAWEERQRLQSSVDPEG